MTITELKTLVLQNRIPKFLIFVENDPTLCRQYIDKIASTTNLPYKFYTDVKSAVYDITTNIKDDYLYCVYHDEDALASDSYREFLTKTDRNIILVLASIDTTKKYYGALASRVVVFNPVDRNTLCAYFMKYLDKNGVKVSQEKLLEIIDCCNQNLGITQNEIDKIVTLEQENSEVLVQYLLQNGFPDYRQVTTDAFVKRIIQNDKTVFSDLLKVSDPCMTVLLYLYNNARSLLMATSSKRCVAIMRKCFEMFNGIVDGSVSDTYALKYLLCEVMG